MTAGKGDVIRDVDIAEMRNLMPQLEVVEVPDAGHMIPWDDEQGFYSLRHGAEVCGRDDVG